MKHMKRIFALALAVMMLLSLAITASAAEDDDIKIKVTTSATGASVAGHTYKVYQIFTGDVAESGDKLSNVAFGKNYTPADMTVDQALEALHAMTGAEAAEHLRGKLNSEKEFGELNDTNNHEITAPTGYYLIIDVSENLPETETVSAYILQALEDVAVKSKHNTSPKTYKKIDDVNDSTGAENAIEWHDSADHDIGDLIDFQLNAVIPSSIDAFKADKIEYPFTFHDTEETGLTFDSITSVYVLNGSTKTALSTADYELVKPTGCCTFEVKFADLTKIEAIQPGSVLVVEYKSLLNENAVLGSNGNLNEMYGEFRNYNKPTEPAYTPVDTVIAFAYKVDVNKVDDQEEPKPLAGAEFQLEKFIASEEGTETHENVKGNWTKLGNPVKTEEGTTFSFKGLDDGYYRLTETVTPDGYNTIEPIEFTVTAAHVTNWTTENREEILTNLSGDKASGEVQEIKFTADKTAGSLTTDVENKAGVVLPETGGIGTTIFYAVGAIMVLVAVVLLVTKKRMASAE